MAKVYSLPDEFENKVPHFSFKEFQEKGVKAWQEIEKAFIEELKKWAIERNPTQEHVGEVIKFPMADGYAQYLVAATKPVQLIHLPLGDAWDSPYANKTTKVDIERQVNANKRMAELFAKKKEGQ